MNLKHDEEKLRAWLFEPTVDRLVGAFKRFLATWFVVFFVGAAPPVEQKKLPLNPLYHRAQREFHRKNYRTALALLAQYLSEAKTQTYRRRRLLWVIDQIGQIHLKVHRDPDGALAFFSRIKDDKRLTGAEMDMIKGWIQAAHDWKRSERLRPSKRSADELFDLGRSLYNKGVEETESPMDDSGNGYFHIATTYLIPFIVNYDQDRRIGEALLMMGDIRRRTWTDAGYWSESHYLREVIRRYPHSRIAREAYELLRKDIHFGYSGSGGDHVPRSQQQMLRHFQRLSAPRAKR